MCPPPTFTFDSFRALKRPSTHCLTIYDFSRQFPRKSFHFHPTITRYHHILGVVTNTFGFLSCMWTHGSSRTNR